jgi:hypothetical protein
VDFLKLKFLTFLLSSCSRCPAAPHRWCWGPACPWNTWGDKRKKCLVLVDIKMRTRTLWNYWSVWRMGRSYIARYKFGLSSGYFRIYSFFSMFDPPSPWLLCDKMADPPSTHNLITRYMNSAYPNAQQYSWIKVLLESKSHTLQQPTWLLYP